MVYDERDEISMSWVRVGQSDIDVQSGVRVFYDGD